MENLLIRRAEEGDLSGLLELYTHLGDNPFPDIDGRIIEIWREILHDQNHHVLLGFLGERPVVSCAVTVVKNLTHRQRPYALVENVVTHPEYRRMGCGSHILSAAGEIAEENNCYKMMLFTGSKKEGTLRFYERAGYSAADKTGFVRWLG
jgi:GNAT superfamily N-acetyltransferase